MSADDGGKGAGMPGFKVSQIDHVHVYVADRRAAAGWYARVLGLVVLKDDAPFDEEDDGPVTISSDGGSTSLALFSEREGAGRKARRQTIAFRVGGAGFLDFFGHLKSPAVAGVNAPRLGVDDVVDHDYSYSVYFQDPDGPPKPTSGSMTEMLGSLLSAST